MLQYISFIDICSSGPSLKIKGNSKNKSALGGIISAIISILLVFLTIYFGIDIVQKKKPNVIISDISGEPATYFSFTNKDLILGWKVTDDNINTLYYSEYLDINVINFRAKTNEEDDSNNPWIYTTVSYSDDYVTCNNIKEAEGIASVGLLSTYNCARSLDLTLGGYYNNDKYNYLSISVAPCKNSEAKIKNCRSPDEIREFVDQGIFFILYFPHSSINPKNFESPVKMTYTPLILGLSNNLIVEYSIYDKILEISTDSGFLLEDTKTLRTFTKGRESNTYQSRTENKNYLSVIKYILSDKLVYNRSYTKIQNVAASVGGLFKILWSFGILIMHSISQKGINVEIMNGIYDFADCNHEEGNTRKDIISKKNLEHFDNKISQFVSFNVNNSINNNNLKVIDIHTILSLLMAIRLK